MNRAWTIIKHEFHEVIPPTIFFVISFHIVLLDRMLMLRQYGLQASSVAGALVAALLVAKVVLIADKLPFINRFPDKPLMYNVLSHFWAIQLWLIVLIFVYCSMRELVRVIGRDRVVQIFFGHPRSASRRSA